MAWLVACGVLWPGRGTAQPALPGTALIVRVPGDERIFVPLRAELGSYRFRVLELPDRPGRSSETLAELATARDAQAALRARPDGMAVELWVQGTGPDKDQGSEEVVSAGPSRNPDLLALRVTEAMRARGLHLPPPTAAGPARTTAAGAAESAGAPAVAPVSPAALKPGTEPAAAPPKPAPTTLKPTPQTPAAPKPATAGAVTARAATPKPATPGAVTAPDAAPAATPKPATPGAVTVPDAAPAATPKPAALATIKPAPPASKTEPAKPVPSTAKPSPLATGTPAGEPQEPAPQQSAADEPPKPAAVSSNAPARPPRRPLLFAEAAPLAVLSPGQNKLGPAIDAFAQLRLQPYGSSSISVFGVIPLWQAKLERDEGAVQVHAWAIGGFADLHVPLRPLELSAGLGLASMLISVRGTNSRPPAMDGDSPQRRLPLFLGRIGLSLALTRDLRLTGRVMAGVLAPDGLQVTIGGAPVAMWGRLLVLGSLGLEVALPWER